MKSLLLLTLAPLALCGITFHDPLDFLNLKRDYLSCQQTYGSGSVRCGNSTSHFCYDPTLDESCCPLDDGYCKSGDFCGPVAGYFCHDGEDPTSCASRLSFSLPPPSSTSFMVSSLPSSLAPAFPSSSLVSSDLPQASSTIASAALALASASGSATSALLLLASNAALSLPSTSSPVSFPLSIPDTQSKSASALPTTLDFASGSPTAPSSATAGNIGILTSLHPESTAPAGTNAIVSPLAATAAAFAGGAGGRDAGSVARGALILLGLVMLVLF